VTALALALYGVVLAGAAIVVWRRPLLALYAFVLGLAAHNVVMALLYGAGIRGDSLEAIQAWKEGLLTVALIRVARDIVRAGRLPFRLGPVDLLALVFGAIVVLYAVIPQSALDGHAGPKAILYGLRHGIVPVAAYFLGRALAPSHRQLRVFGWTVVGAAAAVAAFGLIEEYTVPVEWWRHSGAVGYFRDQLGFDYHGPGGLPDNFAFNSSEGLFRRLTSTYISPLATAFMLVVALLLAPRRRGAVPFLALCGAGLLFTLSRSSVVALALGLLVLALARRRWQPVGVAAATIAVGVGFAFLFTSIAPRTHFFKEDLPYQRERARTHGGLPGGSGVLSGGEPSIRSHLTNLRDGIETVARHPQGYGLGNAGATASRFEVPLKAGESNYTEIGVETGLAGMLLFVAWNLALLAGLLRTSRIAEDESLRWAAGGLAAALAAILALAIQTDVYGVPWLAYCVWSLAGAVLLPAAVRVPLPALASTREARRRRRPFARTVLPRPGSDG
jgi:O-antigen ligase/polysaccharide polymerase Wzy-like membrane protein